VTILSKVQKVALNITLYTEISSTVRKIMIS